MAIVESQLFKVGALSGYHRERATLPRRLGGWAIRNSKRTSHAAFFAGFIAAMPLDCTGPAPRPAGGYPTWPCRLDLDSTLRCARERARCAMPADVADAIFGQSLTESIANLSTKGAQRRITRACKEHAADNLLGDVIGRASA